MRRPSLGAVGPLILGTVSRCVMDSLKTLRGNFGCNLLYTMNAMLNFSLIVQRDAT